MGQMGLLPILSVIHAATIGTKLSNNGGHNGPRLKLVLNRPLVTKKLRICELLANAVYLIFGVL